MIQSFLHKHQVVEEENLINVVVLVRTSKIFFGVLILDEISESFAKSIKIDKKNNQIKYEMRREKKLYSSRW